MIKKVEPKEKGPREIYRERVQSAGWMGGGKNGIELWK